jgi:hypothetical protein
MKARKVVVTIEMLTDKSTKDLKADYKEFVPFNGSTTVKQVQVNVIKDK